MCARLGASAPQLDVLKLACEGRAKSLILFCNILAMKNAPTDTSAPLRTLATCSPSNSPSHLRDLRDNSRQWHIIRQRRQQQTTTHQHHTQTTAHHTTTTASAYINGIRRQRPTSTTAVVIMTRRSTKRNADTGLLRHQGVRV